MQLFGGPLENQPVDPSEEFAKQKVLLHQKAGRAFIVRKFRRKRKGK